MVSQEPAFWSIRATVARARSERESTLGRTIPKLERAISLRGVNLSYGEMKVLSDVSLEIPAGQITGLIGASGGGKTSIGDLVVGLLRPDSGEIFIDELPLAEVDIQRWRRSIGYVPQEMFLLHDSVRQNVILGDQEIGPAQIERALRRAGAADFVAALPEGIDSTVGERGALLSGGQRQRIAIARALVHEPALLLLDEATASLDPETEKALWESLVRLKGEVTVLAISHQPALFSAADRIYRIENGKATRLSDAEAPTALVVA
jgi:ATP-binding cassette subfamily C protein